MNKSEIYEYLKRAGSCFPARDVSILLVLLILIAGTWAFLEITDEFLEGDSYRFDRALLLFLRRADDPAVPKGPVWLFPIMRDITALGGGTVVSLVTLVIIGYRLLVGQFSHAVLMSLISGGGAGIAYFLKVFFARDRPSEVPPLVEVTLYSFPSGHAMMAALVYLSLAAMLASVQTALKIRIYIVTVAVVVVFLIGASRIYLGVHYPSDVLAGWSVGLAWASFSRLGMLVVQRRGFMQGQ